MRCPEIHDMRLSLWLESKRSSGKLGPQAAPMVLVPSGEILLPAAAGLWERGGACGNRSSRAGLLRSGDCSRLPAGPAQAQRRPQAGAAQSC